jgi:8-oxo-dGTP pyrophosphatase MutT (NUDIX family)
MLPKIDNSWYERPEGMAERVSAGGVVVRVDQGALLVALVEERDVPGYVVPKGGQDPGETIEETALREIEEESGLTELEKVGDIAVLERQSEKKVLWSINHYALYVTTQVSGTIKDTEHHMGMDWFPIDALPEMFWPDERRMIEVNRKKIYEAVIARQNPKPRKRMFM